MLATGRVRVAERLFEHVLALADAEGGVFAQESLVDFGLAVAAHFRAISLGARMGFRRFATIDTPTVSLQAEWHITTATSVLAMGTWEGPSGFQDVWRAALGFRVFPVDSLGIDLGVAFDKLFGSNAGDATDPYLGIEWQLPEIERGCFVSLFVERQASSLTLLGARVHFGMGANLRSTTRHDGWRLLR